MTALTEVITAQTAFEIATNRNIHERTVLIHRITDARLPPNPDDYFIEEFEGGLYFVYELEIVFLDLPRAVESLVIYYTEGAGKPE